MGNSITTRNTDLVTRPIRKVTSNTPKHQDMVIVDLSTSMRSPAFGGKSRYECVLQAITPYTGRVQVLAFSDEVREMDANELPPPGSLGTYTDMTKAFQTAAFLEPIKVLLMSDGEPNNADSALDAARELAGQEVANCIIDVLYIGPNNPTAIAFMRQVAEIGRGRFFDFAIDSSSPALLESKIGSLLALPAPGTIEL